MNVTTPKLRDAVPPTSERDYQRQIVALAEMMGWSVYHVANVRGQLRSASSVGFPDLVLVGRGRILYREVKTDTGRLTVEQHRWQNRLRLSGGDVGVWTPACWPRVCEELGATPAS